MADGRSSVIFIFRSLNYLAFGMVVMSMKIKLLRLIAAVQILLVLVCFGFQTRKVISGEPNAGVDRAPNIVMFFIDDLGYADLGCYGSTFHETPVIDQLARQSVRFKRFLFC